MNPTMEKMTKPANMLVKELMQQTMTESLYGRDKAQGSHCHADITSLSSRHTLSRGVLVGAGEGLLDSHFASGGIARRRNTFILTPLSLKWQRASAASQHLERISSHFPRWHRGRALFLRVFAEPLFLSRLAWMNAVHVTFAISSVLHNHLQLREPI